VQCGNGPAGDPTLGLCVSGRCECAPALTLCPRPPPAGRSMWNTCTNVQIDATNCGACGSVCRAPTNRCNAGTCGG
jgi:hypothetical protein